MLMTPGRKAAVRHRDLRNKTKLNEVLHLLYLFISSIICLEVKFLYDHVNSICTPSEFVRELLYKQRQQKSETSQTLKLHQKLSFWVKRNLS